MRTIKLFFCLLILVSYSWNSHAQEGVISNSVATYLESNGSMQQYEYAYDELLKMLGKQYPKSEATQKGWEYLESHKTAAVAEMKKELIPIYEQHFELSEIEKMTAFYQSETGKQLIGDRSQMTASQKEELNTFYNTDLGRKIIEKQPELSKAISGVSENWSRDLYETAVSLLRE